MRPCFPLSQVQMCATKVDHKSQLHSYLSNTLTNLCIALYCIVFYCVVLNCIVLLIYCHADKKFVGVKDTLCIFYWS